MPHQNSRRFFDVPKKMKNFNDENIPALIGESQGRTAVVLTEEHLYSVEMRNYATLLPVGAKIEFLDKLIVKAQKRHASDRDDAPKNYSILCRVNDKNRFIGLGTFTRRDYCKEGCPYISPISKDIPDNANVVEFYNAFKSKILIVTNRVQIETFQFTDTGERTGIRTVSVVPVLDYLK